MTGKERSELETAASPQHKAGGNVQLPTWSVPACRKRIRTALNPCGI